MVFKCFKYIFKHFTRSIGGWISLGLLLSDIAVALVYFLVESIKCSKYIFTLTKNYLSYISNSKKKNAPPKKNISNQVRSEKFNKKEVLKLIIKILFLIILI